MLLWITLSKRKLGDLQISYVIICAPPPTALERAVFFTIIILLISIIIILINSGEILGVSSPDFLQYFVLSVITLIIISRHQSTAASLPKLSSVSLFVAWSCAR